MYKKLVIGLFLAMLAFVVNNVDQLISVSKADSHGKAEKPEWKEGYEWGIYAQHPNGREFNAYRQFVGEREYNGGRYYLLDLPANWKLYVTKDLNEKAWIRDELPPASNPHDGMEVMQIRA